MECIDEFMEESTEKQARVYIYDRLVVLLRSSFYAEMHKHHAIQLVLGLDDSFELSCGDVQQVYDSILIPPNVSHQIQPGHGWHITLLIEPESNTGKGLIETYDLVDSPVAFEHESTSGLKSVLIEQTSYLSKNDLLTYSEVDTLITDWLRVIAEPLAVSLCDDRIQRVLDIIHTNITCDRVKRLEFPEVGLSKSRLAHLFVEQIGITLSRYVLWVRMKTAVRYILSGASLTESAHQAGFSDLAHLSRSFKNTFGLTMSDLFKEGEKVNVFFGD